MRPIATRRPPRLLGVFCIACLVLLEATGTRTFADDDRVTAPHSTPRKIVLLAGKKSHGPDGNGEHDYAWSVRLLKLMFDHCGIKDQVSASYYLNGWPSDPRGIEDADTIVVISDGRDGDKFSEALHLEDDARVAFVQKQMKRGCGLVTFHFSTFAPQRYAEQVLDWSGGYFQWETNGRKQWYSNIKVLDDAEVKPADAGHPILRGVGPWRMHEEFYFDIRFRPDQDPITPILTVPAVPAAHPDGHIVAWARQRPDGGRGFATTCGHYYDNWQHPEFRKLMLNAIVWTAHADIPRDGIDSPYFDRAQIREMLIAKEVQTKGSK
jgi:type 1 glutamine amidotransferase